MIMTHLHTLIYCSRSSKALIMNAKKDEVESASSLFVRKLTQRTRANTRANSCAPIQ